MASSAPVQDSGSYGTDASGDGTASIGTAKPWVGSVSGINLATGNKLTTVPIIGWTARGGMPVAFTLYHNNFANPDATEADLAAKWSFSYNAFITNPSTNPIITWDDGSVEAFTLNSNGSYTAQTGNHATLVKNSSPDSFDYTTPSQTRYRFVLSTTGKYVLASIADMNGNTITINRSGSHVSSIVDPTGRTITLGWTGNQLTSVDALGKSWSLQYGTYTTQSTLYHKLNSITLPQVSGVAAGTTFQVQFSYWLTTSSDPRNFNLTGITNPRGNTTSYGYDTDGTLISITNALNQTTTIAFSPDRTPGNGYGVATITDPNGNSFNQHYAAGKLTYDLDALLNTRHYHYDSAGNVNDFTDARGHHFYATYDSNGNQTSTTDPDSHLISSTYNAFNQPLTVVSPVDQGVCTTISHTYDSNGNLTRSQDSAGHGSNLHFPTNGYGLPDYASDQLGHQTTFGYDSLDGNQNYVKDPNGVEAWSTYAADRSGRIVEQHNILGNSTNYTYDEWGRPTQNTCYAGAQSPLYWLSGGASNPYQSYFVSNLTDYQYFVGVFGCVSRGVVGYAYTASNVSGTVPLHHMVNNSSNDALYTSNPTEYQNLANNPGWHDWGIIGYVFDTSGANRIPVYRLYNPNTGYHYCTASVNEYNGMPSPWLKEGIQFYVLATGGGGTVTTTTQYDANGNVVQVTDPNGNIATFAYDALDRLISKTIQRGGGVSDTVSYTYDQTGQVGLLSYKTNGNGAITRYSYDALNRLVRTAYPPTTDAPYGYAEQVDYDANGNVISRVSGTVNADTSINAQPKTFQYDNENRLTDIVVPVGLPGAEFGYNQHYTYDSASRMTGIDDFTGHTTYSYDTVGRLHVLTVPMANQTQGSSAYYSVTYNYDDLNRMINRTLSAPGGITRETWWNYDPNPAAQGGGTYLWNINSNAWGNTGTGANGGGDEYTDFYYDVLGRVQEIHHPNGISTQYVFDGMGRATDVRHVSFTNNVGPSGYLAYYHYDYDAAGRIIRKVCNDDASLYNYTYDGADQLLEEKRYYGNGSVWYQENFTYDHNGNRLTYSHNNGTPDQYTYDSADKLLSVVGTWGRKDYSYTGRGELGQVKVNNQPSADMVWDEFGHPIVYAPYINGSTSTGQGWNTYRYNSQGLRVLKSDSRGFQQMAHDGISPGSPLLYDGLAVYSPETQSERRNNGGSGWQSLFRLLDAQGSTQVLTVANGGASDSWQYDAFGNVAGRGGSTATPFAFNGGNGYESDVDTGLMLLGHRYYDPSIGRFLSRDPDGDGENWYAYCENDPINAIDPLGLHWQAVQVTIGPITNSDTGEEIAPAKEKTVWIWVDDGIDIGNLPSGARLHIPVTHDTAGVNVRKNMAFAKTIGKNMLKHPTLGGIGKLLWFYGKVRNKGPWDYKQTAKSVYGLKGTDPTFHQWEALGNFDFGAVGAAAGIPEETLLFGAGFAQRQAHKVHPPEFGTPLGGPPYGDDPRDQQWIRMGIAYAIQQGYAPKGYSFH